jgi:signal transduction histidine kinase
MQRNANVGSKLLALIAVPAVVLVAVASMGARARLDDAAEAKRTEDGARLAAASTNLAHELQLERLLTMRLVEGDESVTEALETQRQATDEAGAPFGGSGEVGGLRGVEGRIQAVAGQIQTIGDLRASIDEGNATPDITYGAYTDAIDSVIDLDATLASRSGIPELSVALTDVLTLSRAKEARAALVAQVAGIATNGSFRDGDYEELIALQTSEENLLARVGESRNGQLTTQVRNAMATEAARDADSLLAAVLDEGVIGGSGEAGVEPPVWEAAAMGWLDQIHEVEARGVDEISTTADRAAFEADKSARLYLIGTAAAVILSLLLASLLARRINRRLQRLTTAANQLATEELPRLVEDLRSPAEVVEEHEPITPIPVDSNDEIGQLAEAFNAIQQVTSQVAEEQAALLRRGIADIFVNLARRNQSLLDRQIEFIDGLEAKEQDPDQLENLFKLDHLATRMRRNAESLLVLAGAEPPRRRARPVELADVVRVAIGEVEDFTRISLLSLDDATVGGNTAVDMAHLLSELMENATQFSPPDSTVEVVGSQTPDGPYVLTVADRGIGMSAEQLQEANALLTAPPPVGLALSRSLGFIVVGRLARRLKVSVRLNASPAGGITAVVELPPSALGSRTDGPPALAPPAPAPPAPDQGPVAEAGPPPLVDEPRPLFVGTDLGGPPPAPEEAPAQLSDALPAGDAFERGLAELVGGPDQPEPTDPEEVNRTFWGGLADGPADTFEDLAADPPPAPAADPLPAPEAPAPEAPAAEAPPAWEPAPDWMRGDLAEVEPNLAGAPPAADNGGPSAPAAPAEPAAPPSTPSGLVRRQPQATMSADGERPRAPSARRSPEEVRAMLSRYRRGLDDGRRAGPESGEDAP